MIHPHISRHWVSQNCWGRLVVIAKVWVPNMGLKGPTAPCQYGFARLGFREKSQNHPPNLDAKSRQEHQPSGPISLPSLLRGIEAWVRIKSLYQKQNCMKLDDYDLWPFHRSCPETRLAPSNLKLPRRHGPGWFLSHQGLDRTEVRIFSSVQNGLDPFVKFTIPRYEKMDPFMPFLGVSRDFSDPILPWDAWSILQQKSVECQKPTVKSPQQWLMNGIPIMNYYNPKCMVHSVASFSTLPGLLKLLSSFYQDVPQRHHLRYKFDA